MSRLFQARKLVRRTRTPRRWPIAKADRAPPAPTLLEPKDWADWSRQAADTLPGWVFCKIPNRSMNDGCQFLFGQARNSFAMWNRPFLVVAGVEDRAETGTAILTSITHLRSGFNIAVFAHIALAEAACNTAEALTIDWQAFTEVETDGWNAAMHTLQTAWRGMGFAISDRVYAKADPGGVPMMIWERSEADMVAGRPEKLS